MKMLACLLFGVFLAAFSEELVLWEYDFHTLPPDWEASWYWEFTVEYGAYLNVSFGGTSGCAGGAFGSYNTCAILPEGTDSVTIYADQVLSLTHYIDWSYAEVCISRDQGSNWEQIFYETSDYGTSDPLMLTLTDVQGGDSLQIEFNGIAYGSMYGGSTVSWRLENFVLTAFGEALQMDQTSWGAIKALEF
jgi:hypothetical protein